MELEIWKVKVQTLIAVIGQLIMGAMTFSFDGIQLNDTQHKGCICNTAMLNVIILIVIMLNVFKLSVVMLSVVAPNNVLVNPQV
jgi:hypothetical protein